MSASQAPDAQPQSVALEVTATGRSRDVRATARALIVANGMLEAELADV
jgi:hypothetical protein